MTKITSVHHRKSIPLLQNAFPFKDKSASEIHQKVGEMNWALRFIHARAFQPQELLRFIDDEPKKMLDYFSFHCFIVFYDDRKIRM